MSLLHIAVLLPLIFALIIPFLYRFVKRIHLGWFVLPVPIVLFIYFISLISMTMSGNNVMKNLNWMPHIGMNFNLYVDGLIIIQFAYHWNRKSSGFIFYRIFKQIRTTREFYCYLLLFMGAMLELYSLIILLFYIYFGS